MKVVEGLGSNDGGEDSPPMTTTNLSRLIQAAMHEQNLTQGQVELRGGPSKQTLGQLIKTWQGKRSLDPGTLERLSRALGISRRSIGRAVAVDMGLLPADEAKDDSLTLLTDALRERATDKQRELVVAAARAIWRVLEQHDEAEAAAAVAEQDRRADQEIEATVRARKSGKTGVAKRRGPGLA